MTKKAAKQKLLITAFFLSILMILNAYSTFAPDVHAAELTFQEKGLTVLSDVAGFNMTEYVAIPRAELNAEYLGLPQKETDFRLTSNQSVLRARCSFVNNRLHQIYISDYSGAPSLNQPTKNSVDTAKNFLERYSSYAANPFYGEIGSMLNTSDVGKNLTRTMGNVELVVSVFNGAKVDYTWTYKSDQGVTAPSKNVVLSYDKGLLKSFIDNWHLYTVAGEPKLSSEEAVAIALNAAKSFSYDVTTDNGTTVVSGFEIASIGETSLCYLNYLDESSARDSDPFTLYPSWYVPLGFDGSYPGGVTGVRLRIWADTGEISTMAPMVTGGYPLPCEKPVLNELNQEPSITLSVPVVIAVVFGALGISFSVRITRFSRLKSKFTSSRFCALLLCFLILASIIIEIVPKVRADIPEAGGKSMIYASFCNQTVSEENAAWEVCNDIENRFTAAGYTTTNFCNAGTTKYNVLSYAQNMEESYHRVALFHFGHMNGTTAYLDTNGIAINSSEIDDETTMGKHFFVMLWTCRQADNGPSSGMPFAWTQRTDMSSDGYNDPDGGLHCFISFQGASPAISNQSFNESAVLCKNFIKKFYEYALDYDYSVNDALNSASQYYFSESFNNCPLYEQDGYFTWWPHDNWPKQNSSGWYPGRMRIFGNGDIHLNQYEFTVLARDQYSNYFSNKDVYIDLMSNIANTGAVMKVNGGDHSVFVNDFWEAGYTGYRYTYQYFTYDQTTVYPNPTEWQFSSDWTITAHFNKEYRPGDANGDGYLNIGDVYFFLAAGTGTRGEDPYNYDSRCDFNNDGYVNYGDYLYLMAAGSGTPRRVTVNAYDVEGTPMAANVYVNSYYVDETGNSFVVPAGSHSIGVSVPAGHVFVNFTWAGGYSTNNPASIGISSDITINAYFDDAHYWLTVNACGNYHPYLPASVSIDGGAWTGVAGDSFWVPEGYHSVEVPQYGYYQGVYYQFYTFYGYSGENPLYILVDYDKEVTAFYWGSY